MEICGNLYPKGVITYVGDHTGAPPHGEAKENTDSCCYCGI